MSTPVKFTFKNYLKEIKKTWLILAIVFGLGAIAGAWFAFKKPNSYSTVAKFSIHNDLIDGKTDVSPYTQISEYLMSTKLVKENGDPAKTKDLSTYNVKESLRGVFLVTAYDADPQHAIDTANTVVATAESVLTAVYNDASDYRITVLSEATEAIASVTVKSRIISIAVVAFGALALALIVLFIKFDFTAEK